MKTDPIHTEKYHTEKHCLYSCRESVCVAKERTGEGERVSAGGKSAGSAS